MAFQKKIIFKSTSLFLPVENGNLIVEERNYHDGGGPYLTPLSGSLEKVDRLNAPHYRYGMFHACAYREWPEELPSKPLDLEPIAVDGEKPKIYTVKDERKEIIIMRNLAAFFACAWEGDIGDFALNGTPLYRIPLANFQGYLGLESSEYFCSLLLKKLGRPGLVIIGEQSKHREPALAN